MQGMGTYCELTYRIYAEAESARRTLGVRFTAKLLFQTDR